MHAIPRDFMGRDWIRYKEGRLMIVDGHGLAAVPRRRNKPEGER
jgi:hypothetical protein